MATRATPMIVVALIAAVTLAHAQQSESPFLTELNATAQRQLRDRARTAGYELREGGPTELVLDARARSDDSPPGGAPVGVLCASRSLAARGEPGAVGFHLLPDSGLVEVGHIGRRFRRRRIQQVLEDPLATQHR